MKENYYLESLLPTGKDARRLHHRLDELGAKADASADVPYELFEHIDVAGLNRGSILAGNVEHEGVAARARLIELCGHGDPALTVALPGPSLSLTVIDRLATQEQRRQMLAPFDTDQPVWGAFAVTEPGYGSDAAHLEMQARPVPGGFSLTGKKRYIGNAGRSAYVVVFASVDRSKGQFGIRAFYVPLPSAGVTVDDSTRMTGMRAVRVSCLAFDDCFVPEDNLVGHGGAIDLARSFAYVQASFDAMRPCLSSLMTGTALGLIDRVRRPTPGLVPATRRALAAAADTWEGPVHSARLLAQNAARLFDVGHTASTHASMCKVSAQSAASGLVGALVRTPGIADHPESLRIHRWWRDIQAFRVMEGTADVHHLMIARARLSVPQRKVKVAPEPTTVDAVVHEVLA